jgi:hypothetical protein
VQYAGAVLVLLAIAIRVHNAIHYPLHYGFDAPANWDYIAQLLTSWRLPAPGEGWSTSHPPFFYYLAAALGRLMGGSDVASITKAVRLMSSAIGVAGIACALVWLRREDPKNDLRVLIAGALMLFVPVHIYMSAILGEEIIAGALITLVLCGVAVDLARPPNERLSLVQVAWLGLAAGLAFLTKLSGLLVIAAAGLAYGLDGLRRRDLLSVVPRAMVFGCVALIVGGWPYARNKIEYGYFYPQNLMVHELMFTMPPGERGIGDYLSLPLATFGDPQVLAPDLLHSVWGTTYTTLWFDGHRVMLPRFGVATARVGTALLILGLIPTAAFLIGIRRGLVRAIRQPGGHDTLFLLIVTLSLAGYVRFTWQNPWYATLKASYLLGIAMPFAVYSSEVLRDWTRSSRRGLRYVVGTGLVALLVLSASTFTVNLVFQKKEGPGFVWSKVDPSRHYENAIPSMTRSEPEPRRPEVE